jgi:hypothetical protein
MKKSTHFFAFRPNAVVNIFISNLIYKFERSKQFKVNKRELYINVL